MVELGFVIVDCWFADAPLVTSCDPPPVLTPGLMFAPAFTFELLTPTFASTPTFGFTFVSVEVDEPLEGEELDVPEVPDVDDGLALVPLVDDWLLEAPWVVDEVGLVIDVCWFALAPLVTLCEPLPMFTPGLTSAPMFALELFTSTFASTPTFGFTLSVWEAEVEGLVLEEELEGLLLEEELEGLVLDEELEALGEVEDLLALMSVELELLVLGVDEDDVPPFRLRLLEELAGAWEEPLRFRFVELEELEGELVLPGVTFRFVELEELDGVLVLPGEMFTSVELEELPDAAGNARLAASGTTATPGVVMSVVVVLLDWVSGTLGTQPAGVVFAVSMHFGSRRSLLTLVTVSARAIPNAARSDVARRLILKVFLFIAVASVLVHIRMWHRGSGAVAPHGPGGRASCGASPRPAPSGSSCRRDLQMQSEWSDIPCCDSCRISLSTL